MRSVCGWMVLVLALGVVTWGGWAGQAGTDPKAAPDAKPVTSKPVATMPAVGDGTTTLEIETFKLDGAEVKDLKGASGKAVLFTSDTSSAETTVAVKKGTYEVVVYAQADDGEHDAFHLVFAGAEERLYPDEYGKVMTTKAVSVEVKQDGPAKLTFMAAESGVYLDKVVLKKVK